MVSNGFVVPAGAEARAASGAGLRAAAGVGLRPEDARRFPADISPGHQWHAGPGAHQVWFLPASS